MMWLTGFANAMAEALEGKDYRTYGYSCAGAIGYGSTGSWTSAFGQVNFALAVPSIQTCICRHAWWHNIASTGCIHMLDCVHINALGDWSPFCFTFKVSID